ncbi:S8 family serine peptidase [Aquimarina sp. 2201CG1-2-11]|uniref:S8 family serine peptidase n=1 Tax=Aquimarina discodermiae TaxID=3231043 RepID=UPI003461BF57
MKKSNVLFVLGCFLLMCMGCTQEEEALLEESSGTSVLEESEMKDGECATETIKNQLVVKYKRDWLHRRREIRAKYNVIKVKRCECADKTLELWTFADEENGVPLDIEERKAVAADDPGLEGVDHNFVTATTGTQSFYNGGTPLSGIFKTGMISGGVVDVNIAILDTGIQFDYIGFDKPFLYNSLANGSSCQDGKDTEISGWDFVNQDYVANDNNGHGTIVTDLISQKLEDLGISYRILPIKIFNKEGKGTYFDLLCGYRFAAKKPGMNVINMSFGWCGEPQFLLKKFITETENKGKILIVASAGNTGSDNDVISHYPSSYTNANVLSIAAMNTPFTDLASFSNYGKHSVDFAANGENIVFDFGKGAEKVSGTSFATAFATANAAWFYTKGTPMKLIETKIKGEAKPFNSTKDIKHQAYIKK